MFCSYITDRRCASAEQGLASFHARLPRYHINPAAGEMPARPGRQQQRAIAYITV